MKLLAMVLCSAAFLSSVVFADCGYGTISSVRVDDSRGDFRISFKSKSTSHNGCIVRDFKAIVKPSHGYIGSDTKSVLALCLSALSTGNQIWVEYDWSGDSNGANFVKRINVYSTQPSD